MMYNKSDMDRKSYSSNNRSRSFERSRSKENKNSKKLKIIIPSSEDQFISFNDFMNMQYKNIELSWAEKVYKKYQSDYEKKTLKHFFKMHKRSQWFIDKYHPFFSFEFNIKKREITKKLFLEFDKKLLDNYYDSINWELNEDLLKKLKEENDINNINKSEIIINDDVNITGPPYFGFDPNCPTLFIRQISTDTSVQEINDIFKAMEGFISLSISDPYKSKNFIRYGWALFNNVENRDIAFESIEDKYSNKYCGIIKNINQKKFAKVIKNIDKNHLENHFELISNYIRKLDEQNNITNNNLFNDEVIKRFKKENLFDLYNLYLRRIHNICYFSCSEYFDERILSAKSGSIILRNKIFDSKIKENIPEWNNKVDDFVNDKINILSKKDGYNLSTIEDYEQLIDSKIDEKIWSKVKDYNFSNYQCFRCNKDFFPKTNLLKHFRKKHIEKLEKIKDKAIAKIMYQNFINDKTKNLTINKDFFMKNRYESKKANEYLDYKDYDNIKTSNTNNETNRKLINYDDIN